MTRNDMRSLHHHLKDVPLARWCSPRCKTAHRAHQDQRGQASHLCGVAVHTYRWKRLRKRRSAPERINASVGRDFQLEQHYMRGLATMQMRVALSLSRPLSFN